MVYYPVTVQPLAVAMVGSSAVFPKLLVTVMVCVVAVPSPVYSASNAAADNLQPDTLTVYLQSVNTTDASDGHPENIVVNVVPVVTFRVGMVVNAVQPLNMLVKVTPRPVFRAGMVDSLLHVANMLVKVVPLDVSRSPVIVSSAVHPLNMLVKFVPLIVLLVSNGMVRNDMHPANILEKLVHCGANTGYNAKCSAATNDLQLLNIKLQAVALSYVNVIGRVRRLTHPSNIDVNKVPAVGSNCTHPRVLRTSINE
jgi:hypothetical protein